MRVIGRGWLMTAGLLVAGCGGEEPQRVEDATGALRAAVVAAPAPAMTATDSAAMRMRVEARRDTLVQRFEAVSNLTPREVAELRLDVNATQVSSARERGVRASGPAAIERLRDSGRLVALGDSTEHWILREMDHSSPHVTPVARATLAELGERFHARLARAGLPPYRMKITSALRTEEDQEALRRINSYATSTVSAHQFGTTVDVSHERFAVPAGTHPMEEAMLEEVGAEHAKVLQAELGRAIASLREDGRLHVMMENRQPAYHMTLAR